MADSGTPDKENATTDFVGTANTAITSEPLQSNSDLSSYDQEKKQPHPDTTTSIASSSTLESDSAEAQKEKPWYRRLNPLKSSTKPPVPKERKISREYGAPFLSLLTFQWMAPLITTGYQRPLELNDIWLVNPNRAVPVLSDKLQSSFKRRLARGDRYPLLWSMYETFKFEFWLGGMCQLLASVLQVMAPFTLRYLISFAASAYIARAGHAPGPHIANGIGLVIGVTLMQMFQSIGINHFIYRGQMVGAQSRGTLIAIIFEKAMKISGRAKAGGKFADDAKMVDSEKEAFFRRIINKKLSPKGGVQAGDGTGWSNGRVVNLMSTDTYRIDQAFGMFHMVWTVPVAAVITLILLLINLTYSALTGWGLLIIGIPLLTKAIKSLFLRRRAINKITDQRVSLTQEILQAVSFVKYFGWESSFLERINSVRKREIRAIQILLSIRNAITAVSISLPIFASMLSFVTYSLSNHDLNPAYIFSSLALFNALRLPLNQLPLVIGQVVDAWSSISRIQEFLIAEEQNDDFVWDMESKNAVFVQRADFTWEQTTTQESDKVMAPKNAVGNPPASSKIEPFKLRDLDFTVGRNELIALIGGVGSGKSSVLAALAGDMRRTNGSITMGASRAFCPQYAWIQNTSVKENILFGKPYDREWYETVVDACALRPDIEMLPNGDLTEIGERGITVSGGQKQRLNIARAIYFNSDIILIDDPLSAVDALVGRHIFDNAICGLLKDKCRIMATHQLHVLSRCDRIIWLEEGQIKNIDTFANLMGNNEDFQKLMASTAQEGKVEKIAVDDENKDPKKKIQAKRGVVLMQQEERAVNSVGWKVYDAYIRASGSILFGPMVIILLILSQGANIATSLWLSWWTSNKWGYSSAIYIGIYATLGFMQALIMFAFSVSLSILGTRSSRTMLKRAMTRVLRAPMSFFDTTPLGRITNRFAKDVDVMDNNITDAMRMYFTTLAMITSVFILIIAYFHYFAIALGPLFVVFILSASYYRVSAREIKRYESVLRSGVFARFSEAVSGTSSIRAYGVQDQFVARIKQEVDQMNSAYYLTFSNQRWLSIRLDTIGNLLVLTTGILVITSEFNVNPSIAGLVLSYILSIVQMIQWTVRQLAEVENAMVSTERLHYYGTELEQEPPLRLRDVPDSWPQDGEIIFNEVQMRYREGLPLVLRGMNMRVAGGERIGIVGRTGAGKSSIMYALFRMVDLSGGSITIDGIDIAQVGLKDLRTRLAIIPQDPTLFRGTIRSNIDPFNEHTDLELWRALQQSDLADENRDDSRVHLDSIVEEEGLNFSLGQRQLVALARALVRGAQIIVCDEATSSIDMETDRKIQRTIRTGFKGKTLLCIAHRLKTILNYDRICVMDQGRIAELDTPIKLWEQSGIFRGMCDGSNIGREDFDEYDSA